MQLSKRQEEAILATEEKVNIVLNKIIVLNGQGFIPVSTHKIFESLWNDSNTEYISGVDEDGDKIIDYYPTDRMVVDIEPELQSILDELCIKGWVNKDRNKENEYAVAAFADAQDCYIKDYEQKRQRESDTDTLLKLNITNGTIAKRLYYSNLAIAVATLVAALYYSSEMMRQDWSDYQFSWSYFWVFLLGLILGGAILLVWQGLVKHNKI